ERAKDMLTANLRAAMKIGGVYVLTDARRDAEETIGAALEGGARIVQLREKTLPTPRLIELAKRIRRMTQSALFIVNDRVDVALASDADGVHVGPDDMRPADVRRLVGDKIVGVSVGTVEEGIAAAPYASYFGVGAIYGTSTKADAGDAVGTQRIRDVRTTFPAMPIIAIGGIGRGNIGEAARAGADGAAVVSAVAGAEDMRAATAELVRLWGASVVSR
ncbi:MAG TPA: thiamine phosphate synthase, partial [Thermoanaerobaculia bacterium]|nr:thiamine phosphate synthase [Thermoanaerobaculia bacterium]